MQNTIKIMIFHSNLTFQDFKYVIFPINVNNIHWVFVFLDLSGRIMYYYDCYADLLSTSCGTSMSMATLLAMVLTVLPTLPEWFHPFCEPMRGESAERAITDNMLTNRVRCASRG